MDSGVVKKNDILMFIIVIVIMGSYLRKVVTALSQPEMILLFLAASVRHTGEDLPSLIDKSYISQPR